MMMRLVIFFCFVLLSVVSASTLESEEESPPTFSSRRQHWVKTKEYTRKLVFTRMLPTLTPEQAYQRTLRGWRDDDFGFGIIRPIRLNYGDETTGVGLVIARTIPSYIKEGIVDYQANEDGSELIMYYKILNPGWFTFQVEDHLGEIVHRKLDSGGCMVEWTIEWTPLIGFGPIGKLIDKLWQAALGFLGNTIIEYVARGDPDYKKKNKDNEEF